MQITAKDFEDATGQKPTEDDLDRVNCEQSGMGHACCGWNFKQNRPNFMEFDPERLRMIRKPGCEYHYY